MKKVLVLIVGVTVPASARTAVAVPVVPNFTQGNMTSNDGNNKYGDGDHKFDEL